MKRGFKMIDLLLLFLSYIMQVAVLSRLSPLNFVRFWMDGFDALLIKIQTNVKDDKPNTKSFREKSSAGSGPKQRLFGPATA